MGTPGLVYEDTNEAIDLGLPGGALANSGHAEMTYKTRVGPPSKETSLFTFAGTSFVFAHQLGMRTRLIEWWGDLTLSDAALVTLMQTRDLLCALPGTFTFVHDSGLCYYGCLLDPFDLSTKTRIQNRGLLRWKLQYRIQLEQLEP